MVETVVKDGDAYTDRQTFPFERVFRGDDVHGIISSSGERWREQRRFALHVFRDFGVGKNLMQDRILDEITAMFHKLNKQMEEEPESEVNLCNSVDLAVGSIINNVMFGYRLEGEREPEFWEIKHMLDEHMKKFGNPLAVLWVCYPFVLDHVPYFKQMGQGFQQRLKYFFEFFERKIVEHPRDLALDSGAEPRDYVEAFLKEKRRRELAGEDHRYFTITQLSNNCFDLWIAGQETTSNVLAWAIACLLNHQNALEKLYAELDAVIGNTDRLVTVADRQSLPYTNAVINETLRVANIIPFNIRRTLSRDVCLDGYLLAKGTCIVPEISVVLCDDNIFAEASKFKPERFLDEQGKLQRCDELVPFSQGKRQCLGEPLARMELFLFIANIFNRYKVMSGRQMPSLKRTLGAVVRCEPFTCRMEKR